MPHGYAYARTVSYLNQGRQMLCPVPILTRRSRLTWTKDAYDEDVEESYKAPGLKSAFQRRVLVDQSSHTRVDLIKPSFDYLEEEEFEMNHTNLLPKQSSFHFYSKTGDSNGNHYGHFGTDSVERWYRKVATMAPNRDQLLTPLRVTVRGSKRVVRTIIQDVSRARDQAVQLGTPLAHKITQLREDPKSFSK